MKRKLLCLSALFALAASTLSSVAVAVASPPSASCPGSGPNTDPVPANTPPSVSVNDGDEFTSSTNVKVFIQGPTLWNGTMGAATRAELSNDGGFKTSTFFDLSGGKGTVDWVLQSSREGTFTKIVYVRFWNCYGNLAHNSSPLTDDVILDNTSPMIVSTNLVRTSATIGVAASRINESSIKKDGFRLIVIGSDSISGVGSVEVRIGSSRESVMVPINGPFQSASGRFIKTKTILKLSTASKRLKVRCLDRAGNVSKWKSVTVKPS
jgi:hypothetical protein